MPDYEGRRVVRGLKITNDRYVDMLVRWRTTTPEEIMSTEAMLEETLRILRHEQASVLQSEQNGMSVREDRVYGQSNETFSDRRNWE